MHGLVHGSTNGPQCYNLHTSDLQLDGAKTTGEPSLAPKNEEAVPKTAPDAGSYRLTNVQLSKFTDDNLVTAVSCFIIIPCAKICI